MYIYLGDSEEFVLRITMHSHICPRHWGLEIRRLWWVHRASHCLTLVLSFANSLFTLLLGLFNLSFPTKLCFLERILRSQKTQFGVQRSFCVFCCRGRWGKTGTRDIKYIFFFFAQWGWNSLLEYKGFFEISKTYWLCGNGVRSK